MAAPFSSALYYPFIDVKMSAGYGRVIGERIPRIVVCHLRVPSSL